MNQRRFFFIRNWLRANIEVDIQGLRDAFTNLLVCSHGSRRLEHSTKHNQGNIGGPDIV
jgi:hypothetical protein